MSFKSSPACLMIQLKVPSTEAPLNIQILSEDPKTRRLNEPVYLEKLGRCEDGVPQLKALYGAGVTGYVWGAE
jgi:hypothetical protein